MKKLTRLQWLLIAAMVAAIFTIIAIYIYNTETKQTRKEKFAYLDAIANLKVDQITKWRTERLSEAAFFPSQDNVINAAIVLSKIRSDIQSKKYLDETLGPIQQRHNYKDVFITDLNHNVIFSLNKEFSYVDTLTINAIHQSILKDSIIFNEFYYCKTHSEIHLDIVSPIRRNNKLVGVMVFRFDPRVYLYPLIHKWPTPSRTAECTIVCDEDSVVRILNDVRFYKNAALNLTVTKKDTNYVSVKALSSNRQVLDGIDYRRVKVLASVRKIVGSNWLLISKIDEDEIFEDIRYKAGAITIITLIAFLLFSFLIMFLYKNRQSQVYKDLFFKEKQLNDYQAQTKAITDAAQDAIIMLNDNGNISFWNPSAERMLGYTFNEVKNKNLHNLLAPTSFHSQHQIAFENFKHTGKGNAVGSILEFNAIKKNGKEIPIELSLSALQLNNKWQSVGIIRDVSEKKKSENQLKESEEKFRKAFVTSPDSININKMKDGMYVSINDGFERLTGYTSAEVVGKTSYDISIWDDINDRVKLIEGLKASGYVQNLEARFRLKDGNLKYGLMSATIIHLNDEPHILSITRDITERKKLEQERIENEKNYHQIIEGMSDSVYVIGFDGKIIDVNKAAIDMLGYTKEEFSNLTPNDFDDSLSAQQIDGLINRMPHDKLQSFQTTHISKSKKRIPVEITSTLIKYRGEDCILSIARNITQWIEAQESIYKSESLLNETQRLAKVGGWEYDIEQNKMYWTRECFKIHGINQFEFSGDPNEFISKSIECYNETDKPIVMLTFNRCLKEGIPYDLEFQFTNFKNEKLWIRTIAEPVYFENKIVRVIGNIIDVTERVDIMDKLRNSEKRFRELFESMEEGFFHAELVFDENEKPIDWRFIDVNLAHGKIMNLPRHKVIGKTVFELFPDLEKSWFDTQVEVALTGISQTIEGNVSSLGKYYINHLYSPRKGQFACIFSDITERKLAEAKLKESEERWQFAIEGSDDGVWDWNIKTGEVYFSLRWKTMLGYKDDEIKNELSEWESRVYADDLKNVLKVLNEHLNGNTEYFSSEHRMKCKDGNYKWILDRGKVMVWDEQGNPVRMVGTHKDITERRNAEQALMESEERFRSIVEGAPDAIFIQADNKIVFTNSQFYILLGYRSADEIKGKLILDHIHPDFRELVTQRIKKLNIERKPIIELRELKLLKTDGSDVWVETKGEPIVFNNSNGALVFVRDITERKNTEEALKQSESKFYSLFENSPNAIFISDPETYTIIDCNQNACLMNGYTKSELIGQNLNILHPYDIETEFVKPTIRELSIKILKDRKSITVESYHKRKDGSTFPIESSISLITLNGKEVTMGIDRDISERKEIEKELEIYRNNLEELVKVRTKEIEWINKELLSEIEKKNQAEMLLKQSLEKEKELNQLKSRFISTASHEFRTPLTTILSSAELIQRYGKKWEEEKYKDHLDRITNSVEYLTNLMDDVLTISRIESGRVNFTPSEIDLKDLCDKVISDMKITVNERHQLSFKFLSKENIFFLDPKQIQMIIQNLLSNSYKYSDTGNKIELTIQANEDSLQIKVADNGYGISEEDLPHLFEPFYRSLNTESIQGTGLGLAIVKNAVEMHGGTIAVNSKLGKGSTFIITIPHGDNEKNTGN